MGRGLGDPRHHSTGHCLPELPRIQEQTTTKQNGGKRQISSKGLPHIPRNPNDSHSPIRTNQEDKSRPSKRRLHHGREANRIWQKRTIHQRPVRRIPEGNLRKERLPSHEGIRTTTNNQEDQAHKRRHPKGGLRQPTTRRTPTTCRPMRPRPREGASRVRQDPHFGMGRPREIHNNPVRP